MEELLRYWPVLLAVVAVGVSWGDTRRNIKANSDLTAAGFDGVHRRLDTQNGRISKAEDRLQQLGERTAKLED